MGQKYRVPPPQKKTLEKGKITKQNLWFYRGFLFWSKKLFPHHLVSLHTASPAWRRTGSDGWTNKGAAWLRRWLAGEKKTVSPVNIQKKPSLQRTTIRVEMFQTMIQRMESYRLILAFFGQQKGHLSFWPIARPFAFPLSLEARTLFATVTRLCRCLGRTEKWAVFPCCSFQKNFSHRRQY